MAETQSEKTPARRLPVLFGKTAQALLWFLILCAIVRLREDPGQLLSYLRFEPVQGVSLLSASAAAEDNTTGKHV